MAREYGHTLGGGGGGGMGVPEPVPAAYTLPPAARTRELQNRGKDTLPREPSLGSLKQEEDAMGEVSHQAGQWQPLYA